MIHPANILTDRTDNTDNMSNSQYSGQSADRLKNSERNTPAAVLPNNEVQADQAISTSTNSVQPPEFYNDVRSSFQTNEHTLTCNDRPQRLRSATKRLIEEI